MSETPVTVTRGKQSDDWLKLSHDRKVSPKGWYQQSRRRWVPQIPNSFGLPAGESCPGKTEFCKSCYAVNTEQGQGVSELVNHNLRLLQKAETAESMTSLLDEMLGRYKHTADKKGIAPEDRIFRIHWDGDFYSEEYARAWANVMPNYAETKFWAYTRSFKSAVNSEVDVVPILADVDNLALYLSVDEHNVAGAFATAAAFPNINLAACAVDYRTGRELLDGRPSLICPENIGRMALMGDDGRGACVECRLCPDGKRDVIFSTSHKEFANPQLTLDIF